MLRFFRRHQGWTIMIVAIATIASIKFVWGTVEPTRRTGIHPRRNRSGDAVTVQDLIQAQKAGGAEPSVKYEALE